MIETERAWAYVAVDDYILDGEGTIWRVCAIDDYTATETHTGHLRCRNRAGEWVTLTPKPKDAKVRVVIFDGAAEDEDAKIALLRDQLGAEVVATKPNDSKVWKAPAWPTEHKGNMGAFRFHLEEMHGIYSTEIKTYAGLVAAHEHGHESALLIPHTH